MKKMILFFLLLLNIRNLFASCPAGYVSSQKYNTGTGCGAGEVVSPQYKIVSGSDCGAGYAPVTRYTIGIESGVSDSDSKGIYQYQCQAS